MPLNYHSNSVLVESCSQPSDGFMKMNWLSQDGHQLQPNSPVSLFEHVLTEARNLLTNQMFSRVGHFWVELLDISMISDQNLKPAPSIQNQILPNFVGRFNKSKDIFQTHADPFCFLEEVMPADLIEHLANNVIYPRFAQHRTQSEELLVSVMSKYVEGLNSMTKINLYDRQSVVKEVQTYLSPEMYLLIQKFYEVQLSLVFDTIILCSSTVDVKVEVVAGQFYMNWNKKLHQSLFIKDAHGSMFGNDIINVYECAFKVREHGKFPMDLAPLLSKIA